VTEEHEIAWTDEKISRLWSFYSKSEHFSQSYFSKAYGRKILRAINEPLSAKQDVLDFGCGPGFLWDHMRNLKSNWRYSALDFSEKSISMLKDRISGHPLFADASFVSKLPTKFRNESFDIVLLIEVIEHLSDEHLHATILEATRVLRNGGLLVITTPNEEDLARSKVFCPDCGSIFHIWQHIRSWSVSTLSERLGGYGYKIKLKRACDFSNAGFRGFVKNAINFALDPKRVKPHLIMVLKKPE